MKRAGYAVITFVGTIIVMHVFNAFIIWDWNWLADWHPGERMLVLICAIGAATQTALFGDDGHD
jgi:hypothetical protein